MQRLLGALLALLISGSAALADVTPGGLGVATSTLVGGKLPFDQGPGTDTALGFTTTQFCLTGGALVICNSAITNAMLAGSIDPAKLTVGTGVATALGINVGSAGAFLKNNGDAITGTYTGAPTFSGNLTFSGIPKLTGLSVGTQVVCLGLDSGNNIVLATGACGSGGSGGGTVTNAANLTDHAPVIGSGGTVGVKTIAALTNGQVMCGATGADPTACTVSGDGTMAAGGVLTVTKTGGTSFSALATTIPAAGCATFLATATSASLRGCLNDETGSGLAYFQGGALGTPASGDASNLTGNAAGLNAGTVTTNANLTGPITSIGNATAIANGAILLAKLGNEVDGDCVVGAGGVWTAASCPGGGSSATFTDGTHTVTSVATATFGTGFLIGGSAGSATIDHTNVLNIQSTTGAYAIAAGDGGKEVLRTNGSGGADTIANATGSFGAGYSVMYSTSAFAGNTITPATATINGLTVLKLGAYQSVSIDSDGTNYHAGLGVPQPPTQTGTTFLQDNFLWVALPKLSGTNTWTGPQTFGEVIGAVTTQSGTTYTLVAADCGTEVRFTNGSAVTVTIPATLPAGCNIAVEQAGAGQVSVNGSAVSAATLHSAHSYTKTAAQWSIIGINIETNGGTAVAILTGDGA